MYCVEHLQYASDSILKLGSYNSIYNAFNYRRIRVHSIGGACNSVNNDKRTRNDEQPDRVIQTFSAHRLYSATSITTTTAQKKRRTSEHEKHSLAQ